ncbi:MAG: DUF7518 family protein [Halobacteriota archaeon]
MPKNRVEELEVTVEGLEATIAGLTQELVEVKERLRTLEENDLIDGERDRPRASTRGSEPGVDLESDDIIVC